MEKLTRKFPSFVRANVAELCYEGNIGLTPLSLNDIIPLMEMQYQDPDDQLPYSYHYILKIPYAGKRLNWELLFNPEDLNFAPDLYFNDEQFLNNCDIDYIEENVPILTDWNIKDAKCLSILLKQFVNVYKKQQLEKLQKENIYSSIAAKYEALLNENVINDEDIEVMVESNVVHLLISIKFDLTSLPEYLQPTYDNEQGEFLNPTENRAYLKISYLKLDGTKMNISLQLSHNLDKILDDQKSLELPKYNKETSLVEYVSYVKGFLEKNVQRIKECFLLRKKFMLGLCSLRSKSLIEFDTESYMKTVFLCEVDEYTCLVEVTISNNDFPQERPEVTLYSIYCGNPKNPCQEQLDKYPYSPRWNTAEMVQQLQVYLKTAIPQFSLHKH